MFKFKIINSTNFRIKKSIIKNIFKEFCKSINKPQNGTLNIIFVTKNKIRKLNKYYRKIDKYTDVLSFGYFNDFSNLKSKDIVGELVFCEEIIISNVIDGSGKEKEFYRLLIHSILHIFGFDHKNDFDYEEMQNLEDMIWNKIFEKTN